MMTNTQPLEKVKNQTKPAGKFYGTHRDGISVQVANLVRCKTLHGVELTVGRTREGQWVEIPSSFEIKVSQHPAAWKVLHKQLLLVVLPLLCP